MVPTPGRIVIHRLTEDDARHITQQRVRREPNGDLVRKDDRYPAVVVKTSPANPAGVVGPRVLPDGQDPPLRAASRHRGDQPGTRSWPERV